MSTMKRASINFTDSGLEALEALMQRYPGKTRSGITNRAVEVWNFIETEVTVAGEIAFIDRDQDVVHLRIFP